VIEEAPAPGMDAETREAVCGAAVRAAKAVNYENAGTIEFIADASEGLRSDRIWFMEMNTRLQVEHPVTEEITGQDLVEWQLRVASGEKLPKTQDELTINGHAIEARLYAEDPAKGFLPSVGLLRGLRFPSDARIETGYEEGDAVSPFYDPMIAKVICSEDDRDEARLKLAAAIEQTGVWPIATNAPFLLRALMHPAFAAGEITTGFLAQHERELTSEIEPDEATLSSAAEMVVSACLPNDSSTPWNAALGFRLNAESSRTVRVSLNGNPYEAQLPEHADIGLRGFGAVTLHGRTFAVGLPQPRGTGATHGLHDGEIEAPMPGKVTAVEVKKGAKVEKGQRLLTLEAMKMEHALTAPFDGTVAELNAKAGAQVTEGQLLVKVEASEQ
jgi:3-methylcrotonyl-CoA carboxylase alpha subunit